MTESTIKMGQFAASSSSINFKLITLICINQIIRPIVKVKHMRSLVWSQVTKNATSEKCKMKPYLQSHLSTPTDCRKPIQFYSISNMSKWWCSCLQREDCRTHIQHGFLCMKRVNICVCCPRLSYLHRVDNIVL